MYEGPVQVYIGNAAILTNLGTILYGHGSTSAFNCELNLPMSAYLHNNPPPRGYAILRRAGGYTILRRAATSAARRCI